MRQEKRAGRRERKEERRKEGRQESSLMMLWVSELGSPGIEALCALFRVCQTFGFPEDRSSWESPQL